MVLLTDTSNRDGNPTEARVMNAIEENMKNYLNVRTVGIVGCGLTGMSWAASIPAPSSLYLRERRGGEVRQRLRNRKSQDGSLALSYRS